MRLATEVDDPTAILTQLKFQDLYTPSNFQKKLLGPILTQHFAPRMMDPQCLSREPMI